MPSIQLPLDGDRPDDWLLLVIRAATGVTYEHQYGGYVCSHVSVEGFLVPICQPGLLGRLRQVFSAPRLGGRGISGTSGWREQEVGNLVGEIEEIVGATGDHQPAMSLPPNCRQLLWTGSASKSWMKPGSRCEHLTALATSPG
jgi:hypothetical protein